MGQSPRSSTINDQGIGVPFIQGNAEFGVRSPRPIKFCADPQTQAARGDILLSVRAPVGALNLANEQLCVGRGLSAITATGVNPRFLWYALAREVSNLARVSQGSTFAAVNRADLHELEFRLPRPSEQRKIAAVLESVDDAIDKTRAVIDQAQAVKRGLMQQLFTRGLPGRHSRFKKTEIGEVPEDWIAMTLADAAAVVGGGTPQRSEPAYWNGGVPWATPTDVTGLSGRTIAETASSITGAGLASSSAALLPPHSLLMTTRATIGACAINRVAMATNQGFQSLVPKPGTCVYFLYYLVQYHVRRLKRLAAGTTFPEVSKRAVRRFRVHMPPLSEQRRIAAVCSSVNDRIETNQAVMDRLQVVKRGLMAALLTGARRVTPEPGPHEFAFGTRDADNEPVLSSGKR